MKEDALTTAQLGGEGLGLVMFGKAAVSLAVVVGIILLCAWLLRRLSPHRRINAQHLKVVATTPVGQRERVVIVEVENRWLVLGVGGGQVTRLETIDPAPPPPTTAASESPALSGSFANRLRQAMQHNVRRPFGRREQGRDEP